MKTGGRLFVSVVRQTGVPLSRLDNGIEKTNALLRHERETHEYL